MRTRTIGLMAGALALTSVVAAQTTARQSAELTVSGCLVRGPEGQFHLSNSILASAVDRTSKPGRLPDGIVWSLTGEAPLAAHLGRRVEVSGRGTWEAAVTRSVGAAGTPATVTPAPNAIVPRDPGVTALSESAFVLDVTSVESTGEGCR